jgi:hypothetical protein
LAAEAAAPALAVAESASGEAAEDSILAAAGVSAAYTWAAVGGLRLGGLRLGGLRLGGLHLGGHSHLAGLSGRAFHSGTRGFHVTRSLAHLTTPAKLQTARLAPLHTSALTRSRAALGSRAFAHNNWQHWNHEHPWHHWARYPVFFGWAGPLFWPYAYDDIFDDLFWDYALGAPFWDYGYGDIYSGLFSPYGFDDLAGYIPGGLAGFGGAGSTGYAAGNRSYTQRRGAGAVSRGPAPEAPLASELRQMCGDDSRDIAGWPIDRIQQLVEPTAEQRNALDDLANASIKAAQIIKTACPTTVALTPVGRIGAMQTRIEAVIQAVDTVRAPLERFFGALSDEQKARFNAGNQTAAPSRPAVRSPRTAQPRMPPPNGRSPRSNTRSSRTPRNRPSSTPSRTRRPWRQASLPRRVRPNCRSRLRRGSPRSPSDSMRCSAPSRRCGRRLKTCTIRSTTSRRRSST